MKKKKKGLKEKGNVSTKPSSLLLLIISAVFLIATYFVTKSIWGVVIMAIGLLLCVLIGNGLQKSKKKKYKKLKIFLVLILFLGIVCLVGGTLFIIYIINNAPDFESTLLTEKQSSILYDSKGVQYAKLGTQIRENITYDQLSEVLVDAIIATEDSRFFQHNGFDVVRFVKAAFLQALGQSDAGGASTLSMQVVKNTFTDATATSGWAGITRKFTDIYVSIFQLEKNYTKEEIIEFYVNNNLLGGVWGVQEASQYYFGKNANELNLAEASLIAGMFQSPVSYNPYNYPENATQRRETVLYLMQRHGYITKEQAEAAASVPVKSLLKNTSADDNNAYQGYIDTVCKELQERYGVDPYTTPIIVYTNMVTSKQNAINKIMKNNSSYWKNKKTQAGVVVLNSTNGKVEAIGAGRNRTGIKSYNYATDINRQIGSTAKPLFDYGPGFEYNNWSTYTLINDEKGYTYSNGTKISNYDGGWKGLLTLRAALKDSRNITALKAFQHVDNKKIIEFVTRVGITPEISNGYIHEAHSIGAFTGSNPMAMAGAYEMFSNGGYYYEPYTVSKVIFRETGEKYEYSSPKVRACSDSTAFMMTDVLKGVTTGIQTNGIDTSKDHIATKTGTTNVDSATLAKKGIPDWYVRDYWIVGYTPDIVISVWMGHDEISKKYSFNFNTDDPLRYRLWRDVAAKCLNHNGKNWSVPSSVTKVCVEMGTKEFEEPKLPSSGTPKGKQVCEYFKRGTEPTEKSTRYLSVPTPSGLSGSLSGGSMRLSWNGVKDPGYNDGKDFGYYVYKDGSKLGFTTNTYYVYEGSNLEGTYSVKAGYADTNNSISSANTWTYEKNHNYIYTLSHTNVSLRVGEQIKPEYYDGTYLIVTKDGEDIKSNIKFTTTITNITTNATVTNIDTSVKGEYKVTYSITYGSNNWYVYGYIRVDE